MKLSFNWMCDFVNLREVEFRKIIEKINLSICEIDKIENYNEDLDNVITVEINSVKKIPDRNLNLYKVTDSTNEYSIVSGDLNLITGMKVPMVKHGKSLFGKRIDKSTFGEFVSEGMFCSEKDLKLTENEDEVFRLDSDFPNGTCISKLYEIDDIIITIDNKSITHRPDLWSHFGFARELASQLNLKIIRTPFDVYENDIIRGNKENKIHIKKSDFALSYYATLISNVSVKNSIPKIRFRLEKCGIRSINNLVDVSNYVLLEAGQPSHFFDSHRLGEIKISIEKLNRDTQLKLLDGSTKNCKDCITILNNDNPIALAGVMGGFETAVTNNTVEVLLESAVFRREDIRRSIRQTGIRSEASVRYEKGLNPATSIQITNRIIYLMIENGCPELEVLCIEGFENKSTKDNTIRTTYDFIENKIGLQIEHKKIKQILENLSFTVKEKGKGIEIEVPDFRAQYDITIPEDIVEEVGRTLGYISIPLLPVQGSIQPSPLISSRELERNLKRVYSYHLGYNEVYNYSFNSNKDIVFEDDGVDKIQLKNSMPEEFRFLRTTLFPGLLRNIQSNMDRFDNIKIYELGRVYFRNDDSLGIEEKYLSFAIYKNHESNFEDSEKMLLESRDNISYTFDKCNISNYYIKNIDKKIYHPGSGIGFFHNNMKIAEVGVLHPLLTRELKFKYKVYLGKIILNNIYKLYEESKNIFNFKAPSNFPQDKLDISILMNKNESTHKYMSKVLEQNIDEIDRIYVKSIYTGNQIPIDKKSVTYHVELINYKETFSQDKIKLLTNKLLEVAVQNGFNVR